MISKMFAAVTTLLLLLMAVGPANAKEPEEITFVFISETGAEYTYTLLGPESKIWNGSVHARSSVVLNGPAGLYGYILDGPAGIQYTGSVDLLADGRAEVIFDNFSIIERVDKRAPAAESTFTGTQANIATVVFISHTGNEYSFRLLGPESNVWVGVVHRRDSSEEVEGPPGLYGYTLNGPGGNQFVGHVTLEAGGRAEIVFNDTSVTERVTNPLPVEETSTATTSTIFTYVVQSGDRLIKIAKKFNVDPNVLAASNSIVNANLLSPGQVLRFQFDSYTVRSGDSLTRIARLFGVSLEELANLNKIVDLNDIFIGQILSIPK